MCYNHDDYCLIILFSNDLYGGKDEKTFNNRWNSFC